MGKYSGERKLGLPMIETLVNSGVCKEWIEKINVRAGKLVEIHVDYATKAESTSDLNDLSTLMKDDQSILQEIEVLRNAKISIQTRQDALVKTEENSIRSYTYEQIKWDD